MAELKGSRTEQSLKDAFAGESQARNKYTYFASVAKKEGYEEIATVFQETAEQEKEHAKLHLKLLENLQSGRVFAKPQRVRWRCRNCGFVHEGETAVQMCPVCKHPQAYFEVVADSF